MISGLSFTETLVIPKMKFYLMFKICILCILSSEGSHFRGGTISWMPTGIPNEAKFSFKLGWRYNRGPGCTPALVGTLVTGMSSDFWKCTSGCNWTPQSLSSVNYICTGANKDEDWEQGERDFEHTFQGEGPFVVEYTSCCWIELDNMASTGDWTIRAVVDMANRSDIQKPNSSPITTGKPMYTFQDGCQVSLKIPVMDSDGDNLRCRWSNGDECNTICAALPNATLDSDLCLLNFQSVNTTNGIFAVAITVEDFPKRNITIGKRIYTTSDPMSSTNLQFLVRSKQLSGDCNDRPVFVGNTPSEGALFKIPTVYNLSVTFYIESNESITNTDVTGPAGIKYSTQYPDPHQSSVTIVNTTWTPTTSQVGSHILCVMAEDLLGKTSDPRCVEIKVTEEDIDECSSSPCQNASTCLNLVNGYECSCLAGFTGRNCDKDIDECSSSPCQNGSTCHDFVNQYECSCLAGFTGTNCETDVDECTSDPCQNGAMCQDFVNRFNCTCPAGFTGNNCELEIHGCQKASCFFLSYCRENKNGHACEINVLELAIVILVFCIVIGFITFILWRGRTKNAPESDVIWKMTIQPDVQPKPRFQTEHLEHNRQRRDSYTLRDEHLELFEYSKVTRAMLEDLQNATNESLTQEKTSKVFVHHE